MRWKEQDATDYLESSVLSHLHHSLHILDEATMMTTHDIYDDLNLLHPDSRISQ